MSAPANRLETLASVRCVSLAPAQTDAELEADRDVDYAHDLAVDDERQAEHLAEAVKLDRRIRLVSGTAAESIRKLHTLIAEAKAGSIHVALGFPSWTAYLADALADLNLALTPKVRRELVGTLTREGMSQRGIADAVGVSHVTVSRDQQVLHDVTPEPSVISAGSSPKLEQRRAWWAAEKKASEQVAVAAKPTVTGLDGKTYRPAKQPTPDKRRVRRPSFGSTVDALVKAATDLEVCCTVGRRDETVQLWERRQRRRLIHARDILDAAIRNLDAGAT